MKRILNAFVGLFTKDPWRKLGALSLALLLWYYVHQKITGERDYALEIRPTALKTWESDPGFLYVRVPPERALQVIKELRTVHVTLKGPNMELHSLPDQLSAYYDPGEGQADLKLERMGVALDRIRWDPPRIGALVDSIRPDPLILTFEAIEQLELPLRPELLEVQGSPPEGFEVLRDKIEFHPSSITLAGPHRSIEKVRGKSYAAFFKPIQILRNETLDAQWFALELHPDLVGDSLAIQSRVALALVPLVPMRVSLRFKARIHPIATGVRGLELLAAYRLQGSTEEREWVEEDWVAEVPGKLSREVKDESWILKNVRFLADLGQIPEGQDVESFALEVYPVIQMPPQDRERFSGIQFRPASPGKTKITAEKRPPPPPKTQ